MKTHTILILALLLAVGAHPPAHAAGPDPTATLPPSPPAAPVATLAPTAADLAYASVSPAQKLDLYLPPGAGPFPLIVHVHGGAFMYGDKSAPPARPMFEHLLSNGYAVASLDYRLSGEALFPAQIHDVKVAVRWLRAHATDYHLNPDRFGAWGDSAGGTLVALLGTSGGVAALEGADLGHPDVSSRVQAVLDWYGPTDFAQMDAQLAAGGVCPASAQTHSRADSPESKLLGAPVPARPDLVQAASPLTYVSKDAAPFLIEHGSADCTVPPRQSRLLYDALFRVLGPDNVVMLTLPDAGHGGAAFYSPANLFLVLRFLDKHLK